MTTEQENVQSPEQLPVETEPVNEEAPATPEQPAQELSPKEKLIQQLKTCVITGDSCKGMGDKIRSTAEELGVSFDELLDQVFDTLANKEKPEDQNQG